MTYGGKKASIYNQNLFRAARQLERLRFYCGNYGPKSTPINHNFIQRILENGIDERSLYTKPTPKSGVPTAECEAAVEAIVSRT